MLGFFVRVSCMAAGRGLQAGFAAAFPNSLSSPWSFSGRSSNRALCWLLTQGESSS